jgi:serine phosphatase RsbU (regulator of sigma subunit)
VSGDRQTHPPLMFRSRMMRAVAWLRGRPWAVFIAGVAVDLALMIPAYFADWRDNYIGVPAAITSLVVVGGALVGGPFVGAALALATGVAFDVLVVTDRWLVAGLTSAVVIVVWLFAGIATGMLGDRYRAQVRAALEKATEAREAVERVLDVTPSFHAGGSFTGVAKAVCDAAIETTGCTVAALVTIEDDTFRLVAQEPGRPRQGMTPLPLDAFPDLKGQLVTQLRPSFVSDLTQQRGRSLLIDLAGFTDLVSVLRVPVVLSERPAAVLALGWAARRSEPEPAWLATVQRFADHAAVALEKARRVEAERDAARLYRRFEASLIPHIGTSAKDLRVGVSYSPGESRMRLGGDFIDLVTRSDGIVRAVIGDVTGHGPDAAALGAYLRAAWRALAHRDLDTAGTMATLNHLVMEESDLAEEEKGSMPIMATMCAVEIAPDRTSVSLVTAGHPPALLLAADEIAAMPLGGLPLGVQECDWEPVIVPLPDRWTLLLYTDGITEAHVGPETQDRIGIDGLVSLLARSPVTETPTGAELRRLTATVRQMNGGPLPDDATLMALSRVSYQGVEHWIRPKRSFRDQQRSHDPGLPLDGAEVLRPSPSTATPPARLRECLVDSTFGTAANHVNASTQTGGAR